MVTDDCYTIRAIHSCFPWISATTIYNRISAKLIHVSRPAQGPGGTNCYSLADVVHVGVVDELICLGLVRGGNYVAATEFVKNEEGEWSRLSDLIMVYPRRSYRLDLMGHIIHPVINPPPQFRNARSGRLIVLECQPEQADHVVVLDTWTTLRVSVRKIYDHVIATIGGGNAYAANGLHSPPRG